MTTTRLRQNLAANSAEVYRALTCAEDVARWMVPDGMTSQVHHFDPRVGGEFRISLIYEEADAVGKTTAHTDTYHGRFTDLVRNQRVVQVMEFETADPAMRGEMTVTFTLRKTSSGTELEAVHEGVPPGVSPADNEAGWRMSLEKLAALVKRS